MRRMRSFLLLLLAAMLLNCPARAHVGGKDIYEDANAGPYQLYVTIRPPVVIPGTATVEIRSTGAPLSELAVTPMPMEGEGTQFAPQPDPLRRSASDGNFYTGDVWLMRGGSWKLKVAISGPAGDRVTAVPIPAVALSVNTMPRGTVALLLSLGALLIIGMVAIVIAAVREARLRPGLPVAAGGWARAASAGAAGLLCLVVFMIFGARWWKTSAAASLDAVYKPVRVQPVLRGETLDFHLTEGAAGDLSLGDLIPDHGHLMHMYVVREPGMDVVFHLHPEQVSPGTFQLSLPSMPPGEYTFYGDIVHANGFPESIVTHFTVPAGLHGRPLTGDEAEGTPAPLSAGMLPPDDKLPDGYSMVWKRPENLTANTAYQFQFQLLNRDGKPATDVVPYMGMAGHAAFIKTDGTAFAHVHPEGSAAMAAMMLANQSDMPSMPGMSMPMNMDSASQAPLSSEVSFPYGFPSAGRYRIFVQIKHGSTIETGSFDADVR